MLTKLDPAVLINALRVAAEQYDRDAATCRLDADCGYANVIASERVAQQFERQAFDARAMAYLIEERLDASAELTIHAPSETIHEQSVERRALARKHGAALSAIKSAEGSLAMRDHVLASEDQ